MKKHLTLVFMALFVTLAVGCGSTVPNQISGQQQATHHWPSPSPSPLPQEEGLVRLVHLDPSAENVDILLDGTLVVEDLAFGKFSKYLQVTAGSHSVQVRDSSNSQEVASGSITVTPKVSQTVAILPPDSDTVTAQTSTGRLLVFTDNTSPTASKTKFRIVHAMPGLPPAKLSAFGVRPIQDPPGGDEEFDFPINTNAVAYGQSVVIDTFDVLDFRRVVEIRVEDDQGNPLGYFNGPSELPSGPLITAYQNWSPSDGVNATVFLLSAADENPEEFSMLIVVDGGDAAGLSISGDAVLPR